MNGLGDNLVNAAAIVALCAVLLSPVACSMHANHLIHDAMVRGVDQAEAACRINNGDLIGRDRACKMMRSQGK